MGKLVKIYCDNEIIKGKIFESITLKRIFLIYNINKKLYEKDCFISDHLLKLIVVS